MKTRVRHLIILTVVLGTCTVSWGQQKASSSDPANGAADMGVALSHWTVGSTALFHNVYLGKAAEWGRERVVGLRQVVPLFYCVAGSQPGITHYWRADEVIGDSKMAGPVSRFAANGPDPGDYSFQGGVPVQAGTAVGRNQPILVIYVRARDDNTPDRQTLRNNEEAEFADVNDFFWESSFHQLSFDYTHAPYTGWYLLGRRYDEYMSTLPNILGLFTESLQAAENDGFNLGSVSQVVVVIIGPFYRGASCTPTTFTLRSSQGEAFQVTLPVVLVSTFTGWSRTAHEFGHAFCDFADLYEADSRRVDGWDVMDCGDCGSQTTGWHKDKKAGWFSGSQLKILARPSGTDPVVDTTVLAPYEMENPPADSVQSLRLDVGAELHLYVENRQKIAGQTGSQELPTNGVIITDATDDADQVIPIWPPSGPWDPVEPLIPIRLLGGPITAGASFRDASYGGLTMEVGGTSVPQYLRVTTQWWPNPVNDLSITRWSPPPWESRDIWIDSPVNGWDTYEYSDAAANPAIPGNPVRNGDRPRVGRANRVYARVFNNGHLPASNVQVSFYVADPAAIGSPANWAPIPGAAVAPRIAPGEYSTVCVEWTPSSSSHACIIARIEVQPGEMNPDNNEAQENVTDFDTTSASPWKPVSAELQVSNPTGIYQDVRLQISNLPSGWTGWVSERLVPLAPGETKPVQYTVDPGQGGTMGIGSRADINIVGWVFVGDREVPLGGITSAVHLVQESQVAIVGLPGTVSLDHIDDFIVNVIVAPSIAGLPVALDISETSSGAYSIANGVTDNQGRVSFNIGELQRNQMVTLQPGAAYTFRADLYGSESVQANTSPAYVVLTEPVFQAGNPDPADGAVDVPRDTALRWSAGKYAATHDVYLGKTFADVDNASRADPTGILASRGQTATTYKPAAALEYGQTYYWRVDEVNGTPDGTIFKGNVWSLTGEPYSYPVKPVVATASSSQANMGPEKTIDRSGLDQSDLHGIEGTTMWLSAGVQPNWIQYEFDRVYKLDDMKVWNSNQLGESFLCLGVKNATVEYSVDGTTWMALSNVPPFAQAPGVAGYAANTTISFGGIVAKFVKLTINSTWGGMSSVAGLSEVRFSYIPVQARAPQPATGATGVGVNTLLNWRPGREAAFHVVFFGTDPTAVTNGTATANTVTDHAFDPGTLAYGTTYYWRVDEVDTVTYPGDVWSFTTREYRAVDDFESYADETGREILLDLD